MGKLEKTLSAAERVRSWLMSLLGLGLVLLLGWALLAWGRDQMAKDIYAARLDALAEAHDSLRSHYEKALRRTAVTRLAVSDAGEVSVQIVRGDGAATEFPVPVNSAEEIYVDYVVTDGRILIRRIFDSATPPAQAAVIDLALAEVDWDALPEDAYGKAVYRTLTPGLWEITLTGNGALGLSRAEEPDTALPALPELSIDMQIEPAALVDRSDITMADTLRYWRDRLMGE